MGSSARRQLHSQHVFTPARCRVLVPEAFPAQLLQPREKYSLPAERGSRHLLAASHGTPDFANTWRNMEGGTQRGRQERLSRNRARGRPAAAAYPETGMEAPGALLSDPLRAAHVPSGPALPSPPVLRVLVQGRRVHTQPLHGAARGERLGREQRPRPAAGECAARVSTAGRRVRGGRVAGGLCQRIPAQPPRRGWRSPSTALLDCRAGVRAPFCSLLSTKGGGLWAAS